MNNTKRKKLSGRVTFFLFTLIPVVLYTFFYVVSVINGIRYSFTDWDGMAQKMNFIGWKNYKILLKNPNFWNAIKTTVIYSVLLVIGVIVISLILSISLNSLKKFKTLVKSVYFVPAMIGGVTIALIWDQIYYRVIPVIGKALGISWLSNSVLMSGDTALPAVVFVQIWQAVAMPTCSGRSHLSYSFFQDIEIVRKPLTGVGKFVLPMFHGVLSDKVGHEKRIRR